jgi:hypothetical protein
MASTGLMNGTLIVLSVSTDGTTYNTIGHATSSSISYSLDTPDHLQSVIL